MHAPYLVRRQLQAFNGSTEKTESYDEGSHQKEVLKWLDAGVIYPIFDNQWVSPVHVVPKKDGMTVMRTKKNILLSLRTVVGWRICIDCRKINKATRKDHFPFPFLD